MKRSVGVTFLSIYLILGSIAYFIPQDTSTIIRAINIFLGVTSIILATALFRLLPWGRKATVIFMIFGIVYTFIYQSPIFHKQRIYQLEKRYENIVNDSGMTKYSINDREVTKEEFLSRQRQKIEKNKLNKFNSTYMIPGILIQGLIIFFLSRKKIKLQFETQNL